MHLAAQGNDAKALTFFAEYEIDVNLKDRKGSTALHWACFNGFLFLGHFC